MPSSKQSDALHALYIGEVLPSKRKWKAGASVFSLLSLAGGFAINAYLNPPTDGNTIAISTGPTAPPDQTVMSDRVPYQFGIVELAVTRKSGKIAAIDIGQSSATDGREQAFPLLVDYAIQAQGTNFGNLGGATYTTKAFKTALSNAISKLSQ